MNRTFRIISCLIATLSLVAAARYWGPNKPYTVTGELNGISVEHTAPRTHAFEMPEEAAGPAASSAGRTHLDVVVKPAPESIETIGFELQGRIKGAREWSFFPCTGLEQQDGSAVCRFQIPGLPWASRFEYRFVHRAGGGARPRVVLEHPDGDPMVLKFRGEVPLWLVIAHAVPMFAGVFMVLMTMAGCAALMKNRLSPVAAGLARSAWWGWGLMFLGGVPLGMMMNHFAFDVLWEAVPFGTDITDNKTQVALVFWGLAAVFLTRRPGRHAALFSLAAGLLSLAMFLIPHSM